MQISPKVKKVWDTAMTVLVVLVVLLAVLLVGVRLCGLQVYSVLSGSMEPDYPVGSLIYVRQGDYTTLKPNDVITGWTKKRFPHTASFGCKQKAAIVFI